MINNIQFLTSLRSAYQDVSYLIMQLQSCYSIRYVYLRIWKWYNIYIYIYIYIYI